MLRKHSNMRKIKVQTKISYPVFIIISLLAGAFCALIVYVVYFADYASSKTKNDGVELAFFLFILLPIFFKSLTSKEKYLSEIIVEDNYIELVYKIQSKVVIRRKIYKNEIKSFSVSADISTQRYGKNTVCVCVSHNIIKLNNNESILFSQNSIVQLFGCPYQYILDVIKESANIPNFSYKIKGDNELARADIDYFVRYSKRMPAWLQFNYSLKKMPKVSKYILLFCLILFIGSTSMLIYINLPAPRLSAQEKEYMEHYNKGHNLRVKAKYSDSINELNKAKEQISNNSELYLELAYNYQDMKDYNNAVLMAKEGLKCVDNTNTAYRKYHNFKFLPKNDIALYSIIAKSSRKLENYNDAIAAYSYIIKHSHYTYDDSHFWRGYCYYYTNQMQLAHEDFLIHREVILKYFKDQEETEYKDIYPRYNQKNLENVNKWIEAAK